MNISRERIGDFTLALMLGAGVGMRQDGRAAERDPSRELAAAALGGLWDVMETLS